MALEKAEILNLVPQLVKLKFSFLVFTCMNYSSIDLGKPKIIRHKTFFD